MPNVLFGGKAEEGIYARFGANQKCAKAQGWAIFLPPHPRLETTRIEDGYDED